MALLRGQRGNERAGILPPAEDFSTLTKPPDSRHRVATHTLACQLLSVRFDIPDESLFMHFGARIWEPDYAKPVNGWAGIVQVTRTSGTSWYVEPLSVDHPISLARELQTAQTALFMQGSTGKGARGLSGNCDLGDWQMPFGLTLTVR